VGGPKITMADLFLQPNEIEVVDSDGVYYRPHILANARADGTWEAWIEFHPVDGGPVRTTDRESSQPNREAVEYWAAGLEPVYFEGAFQRAVLSRS
jgi:hypothetical protein